MNMNLQLFLQSVPPSKFGRSDFDVADVSYRTLFTNLLGEYVGTAWDLSKVMLWTPAVPGYKGKGVDRRLAPGDITAPARTGLYKVQGVAVEAIMGGIFHQYVRTALTFEFMRIDL